MPAPRSSRRRFLKTACTAAAAPFILPSRVWSAPVKPNDRIGLALIGYGRRGSRVAPSLLAGEGVQGVAVCDVDSTRREAAKQAVEKHHSKKSGSAFKGCDAYPDHEQIMARDDVDAVMLATPDHWHAPICMAALKAGKDIYC